MLGIIDKTKKILYIREPEANMESLYYALWLCWWMIALVLAGLMVTSGHWFSAIVLVMEFILIGIGFDSQDVTWIIGAVIGAVTVESIVKFVLTSEMPWFGALITALIVTVLSLIFCGLIGVVGNAAFPVSA